MLNLAEVIVESLSLHAECMDKLGTDLPEQLPQVPATVRDKITRQRERVNATLTGVDPSVHVAHIESLNIGLKLILRKLAPRPPEPPKPPAPKWDDSLKKWVLNKAEREAYVDKLAQKFDERGPDSVDDLFR